MKMKFVKGCLIALAATLSASMAVASDQAASLDELLEMVRESRIAETQEHRQREARFRQERENRVGLLNEARATRDSEERRSERLRRPTKSKSVKVAPKCNSATSV